MGQVPSQRTCAPLFIVGAHYDSDPETPAAAAAGGLAVVLELAQLLTPQVRWSGKNHFQFAAYDAFGSRAHARSLRQGGWQVRGMIAVDTVGHSSPCATSVEVLGMSTSSLLLQHVEAGLRSAGIHVETCEGNGRGGHPPSMLHSGAATFWEYKWPAIAVSDAAEFRDPHDGGPLDTPETLNYTFMAKVTEGLAAAIREIAGVNNVQEMKK